MTTRYQLNESNLYVPVIKNLHVLIDDGGQAEIDFQGFTVILVDEYTYDSLLLKVMEFCAKHKIVSLHARELLFSDRELTDMKEYEALYRELFAISINALSRANFRLVLSFLTSNAIVEGVFNIHRESFEKSAKLPRGVRLDDKYKELYSYIAFPTMELFKRIRKVDDDMQFYLHIDRRDDFQNLAEEITSLPGTSIEAFMTVRRAIIAIFNSYKKLSLGIIARVDGIHIADNQSSPIIGIADAFSNFSFNFAKVVMQGEANSTETQKLKYRLFREVLTTMIGQDETQALQSEENIKNEFAFDGKKVSPKSNKGGTTLQIF